MKFKKNNFRPNRKQEITKIPKLSKHDWDIGGCYMVLFLLFLLPKYNMMLPDPVMLLDENEFYGCLHGDVVYLNTEDTISSRWRSLRDGIIICHFLWCSLHLDGIVQI